MHFIDDRLVSHAMVIFTCYASHFEKNLIHVVQKPDFQGCVFSVIPADDMSALAAMSPLGVILSPYPQHYTDCNMNVLNPC